MTKAQKMAAGLALIGDAVTHSSFYNSENDASFGLARALVADEVKALAALGFGYSEFHCRDGSFSSAQVSYADFDDRPRT